MTDSMPPLAHRLPFICHSCGSNFRGSNSYSASIHGRGTGSSTSIRGEDSCPERASARRAPGGAGPAALGLLIRKLVHGKLVHGKLVHEGRQAVRELRFRYASVHRVPLRMQGLQTSRAVYLSPMRNEDSRASYWGQHASRTSEPRGGMGLK